MSRAVPEIAAGELRSARNLPACSGQSPDASLPAAEAMESKDTWGAWSGVYRQGGCIPFAFPGLPEIGCVFGTALCGSIHLSASGDGDAVTRREALLAAIGLARWVELCQVHKDGFIVDARPTPTELPSALEADGSCTRERGLGLLVKTADCQPLFFAAGDGSAVAALHVGWRGNAADYPAVGLSRFCEAYGLDPAGVLAVRGPSLGPGASEFVNFGKEWLAAFAPWFDAEKQTMDLWRLTRDQLMRVGMPAGNIFSLDLCTCSLPGLFFSHRRGDEGRQGSLVWIRPAGEPASAGRGRAQGVAGPHYDPMCVNVPAGRGKA
ncbi:MAG: polyphenol oxidase family protein [Desulfovibrio sp.]|nr:polyphenol oxidase family protein [Desulfovibrio sp.]